MERPATDGLKSKKTLPSNVEHVVGWMEDDDFMTGDQRYLAALPVAEQRQNRKRTASKRSYL